jgi:outer membrane immunogenic protein
MRPAAPSAARSAIAGRPARSCSALKARATGPTSPAGNRNRTKIDAFGLFTGQVGYAWNNALLYVKGGAAVTDNRYSILTTAGGALLASTDETRWGGTVGVGFEYGFAPNWSFGVEYDHLFMGSSTNNFATLPVLQSNNIKQDVDLFTARVNYKFGGPVVARY